MNKDRLTGPGGFIDISQSTKNVVFMTPMTAIGLKVANTKTGLVVEKEGEIKKFVQNVFEKTFSGDEAVRRGQHVLYVSERAVFRRTAKHDVIELIEIAPNVDLQTGILDQMDFIPVVNPSLKVMDGRIFREAKMQVSNEMFGSLEGRCTYHERDHTMFLDLFGITLNSEDDVIWFFAGLHKILGPLVKKMGKIDMVVQYDGFDLRDDLSNLYVRETSKLESEMYKSVKRYTGQAFKRAKLKRQMKISEWVSGNTRCIFFSIMSDQCKNLIITMHWNIRTQKNFLMNLMQVKLDFYHEKNYAKDAPKSLIFSLRPVISSCSRRVTAM